MSELHNTIVKTVIDGLMDNYKSKNPPPKPNYSKLALEEIIDGVTDLAEFKITSALLNSKAKDLVPNSMFVSSMIISDDHVIHSNYFLDVDAFPSLSNDLYTDKEGKIYKLVSDGYLYLKIPTGSKFKDETRELEAKQENWSRQFNETKNEVLRNLRLVRTVQDLYLAWPEAAEFLPESAKVTGLVLPTDELNKKLRLS